MDGMDSMDESFLLDSMYGDVPCSPIECAPSDGTNSLHKALPIVIILYCRTVEDLCIPSRL